jgi:hypothetical protein
MLRKTTLALVPALVLAACGGGGDRDPAADECDALFELVCDRVVECQFMGYTHDSCMAEFRAAMGDMQCEDADQVSATYASCMNELMTQACTMLFPTATSIELPFDCNGAILFE